MRDIRSDLKERLQVTVSERQDLEARLRRKVATEDGIRELLKQEDERFAAMVEPLFPETDNVGGLRKLILHVFAQEKRPLWLEEIKAELIKSPYNFGERAPGRAIHFALIGMQQTGEAERLEDKRWVAMDIANRDSQESVSGTRQ